MGSSKSEQQSAQAPDRLCRRSLTIPDDHPDENRCVTIGMDALARLLVVVWTYRGENIRIISARKATRFEQRQYNEGI